MSKYPVTILHRTSLTFQCHKKCRIYYLHSKSMESLFVTTIFCCRSYKLDYFSNTLRDTNVISGKIPKKLFYLRRWDKKINFYQGCVCFIYYQKGQWKQHYRICCVISKHSSLLYAQFPLFYIHNCFAFLHANDDNYVVLLFVKGNLYIMSRIKHLS